MGGGSDLHRGDARTQPAGCWQRVKASWTALVEEKNRTDPKHIMYTPKQARLAPLNGMAADMPNSTASQLYTYGKTFRASQRLLPYDFNYVQIG